VVADTDNLYLTLSAWSTRPDLYFIAWAKLESAEPKLRQAGADRVVNPQLIGGSRIAAMTLLPEGARVRRRGVARRLARVPA
jgi:voltage-gated potassium channel